MPGLHNSEPAFPLPQCGSRLLLLLPLLAAQRPGLERMLDGVALVSGPVYGSPV